MGWDKLIPESMAMYHNSRNSFRLASKPTVEARMWMLAGFAGGIEPWWHHVGAYHEDRRSGMTQALIRARIPYLPVNADHFERDAGRLAVLVLPNVGTMTDEQCAAVWGS